MVYACGVGSHVPDAPGGLSENRTERLLKSITGCSRTSAILDQYGGRMSAPLVPSIKSIRRFSWRRMCPTRLRTRADKFVMARVAGTTERIGLALECEDHKEHIFDVGYSVRLLRRDVGAR